MQGVQRQRRCPVPSRIPVSSHHVRGERKKHPRETLPCAEWCAAPSCGLRIVARSKIVRGVNQSDPKLDDSFTKRRNEIATRCFIVDLRSNDSEGDVCRDWTKRFARLGEFDLLLACQDWPRHSRRCSQLI